jgi:hypothetical protein
MVWELFYSSQMTQTLLKYILWSPKTPNSSHILRKTNKLENNKNLLRQKKPFVNKKQWHTFRRLIQLWSIAKLNSKNIWPFTLIFCRPNLYFVWDFKFFFIRVFLVSWTKQIISTKNIKKKKTLLLIESDNKSFWTLWNRFYMNNSIENKNI